MGKSLLSMGLRRIKSKHGDITIHDWSARSGVPESTIARFLSASLNIPNFPAVCAMLKCLGESIDEFYDHLDEKIDAPADALKLDAVPVSVIGDIPVDMPEDKAAIQERIIVQTEEVQQQRAIVREKDAEIALLEARLEMTERVLEEKERTISNLEDINRRRLDAIKALCAAQ
jgi:hypothetical protein